MNRRGFTVIELLMVVAIMGILVNLALPAISTMRRKAQAVHVVADFGAIRVAAFDRYAADGAFPPTDSWGSVPPRMKGSLPNGFAFRYGTLEYRWRTWRDRDRGDDDDDDDGDRGDSGRGRGRGSQVIAGLEIKGRDRALIAAIRGVYRGPIVVNSSREITLMIQ